MMAAEANSTTTLLYLLQLGANPLATDGRGHTALSYAKLTNSNYENIAKL